MVSIGVTLIAWSVSDFFCISEKSPFHIVFSVGSADLSKTQEQQDNNAIYIIGLLVTVNFLDF